MLNGIKRLFNRRRALIAVGGSDDYGYGLSLARLLPMPNYPLGYEYDGDFVGALP